MPWCGPGRLITHAGYKSWCHNLAHKLTISQYHIPAPNPEIAAQVGAQVAPPESKESPRRLQRGPEPPQPYKTYHQDHDQDLHPPRDFVPDYSERPVAGHAKCQLIKNMFQQLWLATYPRSAQLTLPDRWARRHFSACIESIQVGPESWLEV